jgi:hypothetical protein
MQWTTETPHPVNSPCPTCGLLFYPRASENMTTAKFKSDDGIVYPRNSTSSNEPQRFAVHLASAETAGL